MLFVLVVLAATAGCKKDKPKETSEAEPISSVARAAVKGGQHPMSPAPKECEKLCALTGKCALRDGKCYADSEKRCNLSYACKVGGLCHLKDEQCVALTDEDCKRAEVCAAQGACMVVDGKCGNASQPVTSASAAPAK